MEVLFEAIPQSILQAYVGLASGRVPPPSPPSPPTHSRPLPNTRPYWVWCARIVYDSILRFLLTPLLTLPLFAGPRSHLAPHSCGGTTQVRDIRT